MQYNDKQRIELADTAMSAILKVAEGNPGAISVCVQVLKENSRSDPDSILGGLGPILAFDATGLYGSKIWELYKDKCGENLIKTLAVLRAHQLGFLHDPETVQPKEVDGLLAKVRKQLPKFGVAELAVKN